MGYKSERSSPKTSVEGLGNQDSHIIVNLQSVLPTGYAEICTYPTCYQNSFIQKLMKTDAETNSQTSDQPWGILLKRGRKDCRKQGMSTTPQENPEKQLNWAQRNSQSQNLQPGSLYGTDPSTLHIFYRSIVMWSSCGTPNSERQAISDSCCFFPDPTPHVPLFT